MNHLFPYNSLENPLDNRWVINRNPLDAMCTLNEIEDLIRMPNYPIYSVRQFYRLN